MFSITERSEGLPCKNEAEKEKSIIFIREVYDFGLCQWISFLSEIRRGVRTSPRLLGNGDVETITWLLTLFYLRLTCSLYNYHRHVFEDTKSATLV